MRTTADKESNGFAAHIHAPWGAGKTSVLKMMRQLMIDGTRVAPDGRKAPRWVVVDFNAWEHERRNPPWWPLVEQVKKECLKSLSGPKGRFAAFQLRARWVWWRSKTDFLPYLVAGVVALLCLWPFWEARPGIPPGMSSIGVGQPKNPNPGLDTAIIEWGLKLFTAGIAGFAAFLGASRFIVFGSAAAAQLFESISHDPLHRVTKLFRTIVEEAGMPVCVFIDDLDRCRASFVVELLGGIQTLFRHKNIFYLVAADRGWIKASFASSYDTFAKDVGNVGQPLGYLFLEKVFQLSTPLPGIGGERRAEYLKRLLGGRHQDRGGRSDTAPIGSTDSKQFESTVASARKELRRRHGGDLTPGQGETFLKENLSSEARAAVVLELNISRAAEKEARHLLESFVGMLPDNPRIMKRMINALAMRQAIDRLEQNEVAAAVLARWTILEQWWPALADLLIEHPEWIEQLAQEIPEADKEKVPEPLRPFANSKAIRDIIGKADVDGLTTAYVQIITRGSAT